jgi:hypothetical protein
MSPRYNGRPAFTATVHADGQMSAKFWRKIRLRYPGGRTLTLVYLAEPADSSELSRLMWQLQVAAERYGFEITITDANGITTQVPPIPSRSCRVGA